MQKNVDIYDIIIIGGGASGMMAATLAGARGKKVLLIEKNKRLGEKLRITGGGRCNITNAEHDIRKLLAHYGKAEQFLYSPFSEFGVKETIKYFESRDLPIVVEANNRAFPKTQKAADVAVVLEKELQKHNVSIKTSCTVKKITHAHKRITQVETDQGNFKAQSYILATGGTSHPETGSTGDGFVWLAALGHNVKSPTPSIVPIAVKDTWIKKLKGVSVSNAKITFFLESKKQFTKTGPLLFTHFGLSGPLILNSAGRVAQLLESGSVTGTIDLFPESDHTALDTSVIALFDANKNKLLKTAFRELVPQGTSEGIQLLLSQIDFTHKVHSVSKENRKRLIQTLKALPFTVTHLLGKDRAVVADGGVHLSEIDMKTMRSKQIDNLFITGDLLDINRPSGGYSLQLCWTTGYIAGMQA
ncbi:MAG: NAD(P)/FAD-dependent oxidoreductase [Candidatus Pacebacteria bacterium]|jgi:hypothetical protein|nr:NAD(P)/FAD-dependent oxidoreductase [Candidatus Paceibacterota bacterium]